MKFLALSDLHLGKRLCNYSLLEDQEFVLNEALALATREEVDAVLLSGDIYDSAAPSSEATEVFDTFVSHLWKKHIPLLAIAGNHDSPEKLHYASSILAENGIHFVTKVKDSNLPIEIAGVNFYLLPFVTTAEVNASFKDADFHKLSDAVSYLLDRMELDPEKPNVLLAHQAVIPSGQKLQIAGSETEPPVDENGYVGNSEIVPASLFEKFDYVALGHIHKAWTFPDGKMRYPGAILKYDKSEANLPREFTLVTMDGKKATIETRPILPLRDLTVLTGKLEDLCAESEHREDYVYANLTDEQYQDEPMAKLKAHHHYTLGVSYGNLRQQGAAIEHIDVKKTSKNELFGKLYEHSTGKKISPEEEETMKEEIREYFKEEGK